MFEVALEQGDLFRKIITAISDLVQDGNFQVDGNHISFQGMDSSHVSLVALSLKQNGFKEYRCDRELTLGINFSSLNKVLKCMGSNDKLMLKAQDNGDTIFLCFENPKSNRLSNFELKLMDIDQEQLGIPDTNYGVNVSLPSQLFTKIIRDLSAIGDSVTINVSKAGIKFTVAGDIGKGEVHLSGTVKKVKKPKQEDTQDTQDTQDIDEDMKEPKKEPGSEPIEKETETKGGDNENEKKNDDNNDEDEDDDMEVNAVDDDDNKNDDEEVLIRMNDDVSQTFALKYLANFTKGATLSKKVLLSMDAEVPLRCEYKIDSLGDIAYFLAPKIDDDE